VDVRRIEIPCTNFSILNERIDIILQTKYIMTKISTGNIECRAGCGACCIAPSLSSPIPEMPAGKPAGVRCIQLTPDNRCRIYGKPERPEVCSSYQASKTFCGATRSDALRLLKELEIVTGR
jgi:uncharacterized protein